ncbi:proline iminopeptidase [Mycena vulgaris]|nr:proline iminopeptidase [Mycena vulgaris]
MYPDITPYETGMLKVSDIHTLYYEFNGNKDGTPVVFLHGGPGGGCDDKDRSFFNPNKYRIILFDQRGSGKSTPSASLEDNTTWDLVKDIEKLREHIGIEKWHVFGGSWGSTLSLAYAQAHPDRVASLLIVNLKANSTFSIQNGASHLFPEAWEEYIAPIPEQERHDMILACTAAKAWSKYEMATSRLFVDPEYVARATSDHFANAFARIENHYFVNTGFMRDGQLLEVQEIDKIRHIPTIVVQGRYDVVCPATTAYALKKVWPELTLHIVPDAGHSSREKGTAELLVQATDKFADLKM